MDTNDLINKLPETVRNRAKHVFAAVLDYIFETMNLPNKTDFTGNLSGKKC